MISGVGLNGLPTTDAVNVQGTSYHAYEGKDIPRGQGVELEFTGLPLPGVWARFSDSITEGKFWQVAIPCALGATLATMLLHGLIWGYRPSPAVDLSPKPSEAVNPVERAVVVERIAALDKRYQRGEESETSYRTQRMELISQVLYRSGDQYNAISGQE